MPKVEMDVETSAAPEQVRAALLDFGPDRPSQWPGITAKQYKVFEVGDTTARIREGTGSFWAIEDYDWSDPRTVRWTVVESNFNAPGSYVQASIDPRPDGGSLVHIEWSRMPTSIMGKIAARMIVATRGKPVASSFQKGLDILEKANA